MEFKIDETKIMDYLYGNLSPKENELVEKAMESDEALRLEITELRSVMEFMGKSEDKEVIAPSFVFQDDQNTNNIFRSTAFTWVASIAACLLILMFSAFLTGFNISSSQDGIMIGFNSGQNDRLLSKSEVTGIMKDVLSEYNQDQENKLRDLESKLSSQMEESRTDNLDMMKSYLASNSKESRDLMTRYIAQSNKQNRDMISNYFQVSNEQQKEYLNSVLTDFSSFYNNQRKQDLETIRTGLLDYKNSNDQKLIQTDMVLANLVDMVNSQNK